MLVYLVLQIYILHRIGLWHEGMLSATIFWIVVPYTSIFKDLKNNSANLHFIQQKIINFLSLTIFLEYIVGLKSFPFIIELILIPVMVIIAIFSIYAEKNKKYKSISILFSSILASYVLIDLSYSFWYLIYDWKFAYLSSFFAIFIMSVSFIPFLFFLRIYVAYENFYSRIEFLFKESNVPKLHIFLKSIIVFKFNIVALQQWEKYVGQRNIKSQEEINASIKHIKDTIKREKNPKEVDIKYGWSPYIIKDCLSDHGLTTDNYNNYFEDEWIASGDSLDLKREIWENRLSFNILGTQDYATQLKLLLYVDEPQYDQQNLEKVKLIATELFKKAIGLSLPEEIAIAILKKENISKTIEEKEIKVVYEKFPNKVLKGKYKLTFSIQNSDTEFPV